jgi:preprotein translocase subunit SecG
MYAFLLTLLIVDALLLAAVVLLQAGQGGGLASLGGGTTDLVVGGRQAATLLTKMSWICGAIFLVLALLLSLVSPGRAGSSSEVLERLRQTTPTAEPSALPLEAIPAAPLPTDSAAAPAPAN